MAGCAAESAADGRATPTRVLVGIPSFRRPDGLRRLLRSLAEQRLEGVEIEVFVADNDAAAREAAAVCEELAGRYRWPLACAVVSEPGISAARNRILEEARERGVDLVAMLDDDEEADPRWLHELLTMRQSMDADVVGGPVEYLLESEENPALRRSGAFQPRPWAAGRIPMIDATGNVLLSCDALERNGWPRFDAAFGTTGGEDKEYFTRMRKAGARFAWAPSAVAREHVPAARTSAKRLLRRAFRVGNSDLRITRLHEGRSATALSAGKALAVLAAAPAALPLLLFPSARLWVMRKCARSAGKLTALTGRQYHEYARPPSAGSD